MAPARSGGSLAARDRGGPLHARAADGALGLQGIRRGKTRRTTTPDATAPRRPGGAGLLGHQTNQLWVADLTEVATWSGFVDVAFIIDAFGRFLVGWQAARSLATGLALDALEMAP